MRKNKVILGDDDSLVTGWTNRDNADFYENISVERMKEYARVAGFDQGIDIQKIKKYIACTRSILEIGGCYGRVLTHLIRQGYQGELFTVERSAKLYTTLSSILGDRVSIYHQDVYDFQPNINFDMVLWMWSGISDFPQKDHTHLIQKMTRILSPTGVLVMDTICHKTKPNNNYQVHYKNQSYMIRENNCTARGYIPSSEEIDCYIDQNNLRLVERIPYQTLTDRPRVLHIIARSLFNSNDAV